MRRDLLAKQRRLLPGLLIFTLFLTGVIGDLLDFDPNIHGLGNNFTLLSIFVPGNVMSVWILLLVFSFAGSVKPYPEADAVVHLGQEWVYTLILVYQSVENVLSILSLVLLLLSL